MAELDASLSLDYSEAISGASDLSDAIASALGEGAVSGASAISEAISGVVAEPVDVPVNADTAGAEAEISGLEAEPVDVPVEAETEAAQAEISALDEGQLELPLDVDTAAAQGEIDALEGEQLQLGVNLDTSDAESEIDSLTSASGELGGAGEEGASGLGALEVAAGQASGAAGLATGEVGALGGAASGLVSKAGPAGVAVAALGAGVIGLSQVGIDAVGNVQRFNQIVGDMRDRILHVDVGNLNVDLRKLAVNLGSDDEAALAASATLFQFGINAGKSREESAKFSETVLALAARAVALNPALGDVDAVAGRMSRGLARGGRFAEQYGISLTAGEIASRAFRDTGKTTTSELTQTEKAMAGAAIAAEKYGGTMQETIARGAENPIIAQRRLGEELRNVAEKAGAPIAFTLLDVAKEGIPVAELLAQVLSQLGQASLPLVGAAAAAAAPPLQGLTSLFDDIPTPVVQGALALGALEFALTHASIGGRQLDMSLGPLISKVGGLPAVVGAAGLGIGVLGLATGNTTETVLGFTAAGGALGFMLGGPLGAGIGAATGAVVGYGLSLIGPKKGTDDFEVASNKLANTVKGAQTPAILNSLTALADQATHLAVTKVDADQATGAQQRHAEALGGTRDALIAVVAEGIFAKESQNQFNQALKEGPANAFAFIGATQQLGRDTTLYEAQLNTALLATREMAQAQAQVAVATKPLSVNLEEAATASGTYAARQLEVAGAASGAIDAQVKLASAYGKYGESLSSGSDLEIKSAANALATAAAQEKYATTLFQTGDAVEAAKVATGEYRNQLAALAAGLPPGPLKDELNGIVAQMDVLATTEARPKVFVDAGDSLVKTAAIQAAVDELVRHGTDAKIIPKLETAAAVDGTGQIQAAIDAIRQGAPPAVILNDLATGNIADIMTRLAEYGAQHPVATADVDNAAALANIQNAAIAGNQFAATIFKSTSDNNPGPAVAAIGQALGVGQDFASRIFRSIADNDPNAAISQIARALGVGRDYAAQVFRALVGANPDEANRVFADIDRRRLQDKVVNITTRVIDAVGLQHGGDFPAGTTAVVGEAGRELVHFPHAGTVIPHAQTERILAGRHGGGGDTFVIQIDARGATREAVRDLKGINWRKAGALVRSG